MAKGAVLLIWNFALLPYLFKPYALDQLVNDASLSRKLRMRIGMLVN